MKALRSALASRLLADPDARAQLRQFVGPTTTNEPVDTPPRVTIHAGGKELRYQLVVVPKVD